MTARSALAFSDGAAGPLLASAVADGKRCPKCGTVKPKADFSRNRHKADGLQARCRDCVAAFDRTRTVSQIAELEIPDALLGPDDDLSWRDAARCAQSDAELFFPEKGGSNRIAKRICRACPVRAECLEFALGTGEEFGIWGGLSEIERRRLLRQGAPNRDRAIQAA